MNGKKHRFVAMIISIASMIYLATNWENEVDAFLSAVAMVFIFFLGLTGMLS